MKKPMPVEYAPYYQKYIDLVEGENFEDLLDKNTIETIRFFESIDDKLHNYKYASDKWSIKDVLMHIIDTERGFSNRAIFCVRRDGKTPLFGMDENLFADNVDVSQRTMKSLLEEFLAVRSSLKFIFEYANEEDLMFLGNSAPSKISARAIGFINIGHVIHHLKVVKEKYL